MGPTSPTGKCERGCFSHFPICDCERLKQVNGFGGLWQDLVISDLWLWKLNRHPNTSNHDLSYDHLSTIWVQIFGLRSGTDTFSYAEFGPLTCDLWLGFMDGVGCEAARLAFLLAVLAAVRFA